MQTRSVPAWQTEMQNGCGGYPMVFDMLGRAVCGNPDNLASAYYLLSDAAIVAANEAGTNMCPDGMRPGLMVIKGAGKISTCAGKINQEDVPDMNIIDWPYRIVTDVVLVLAALVLLIGITLKLTR